MDDVDNVDNMDDNDDIDDVDKQEAYRYLESLEKVGEDKHRCANAIRHKEVEHFGFKKAMLEEPSQMSQGPTGGLPRVSQRVSGVGSPGKSSPILCGIINPMLSHTPILSLCL